MSRINYQAGPARARERLGTKLAADRFRREISKVLSNAFVRRLLRRCTRVDIPMRMISQAKHLQMEHAVSILTNGGK